MQVMTREYNVRLGDTTQRIPSDRAALAARIDTDQDGVLSPNEVESFISQDPMNASCSVRKDGTIAGDKQALAKELSYSLAGVPNPDKNGYHSFDELIADFDKLSDAHPGYVQKSVIGKTAEGRDIVAYKFSEGAAGDTSNKTGVVITGCHHAREWMTVEAPLKLAQDLLEGIDNDPAKQQRMKDSEVWIVPCLNIDGYEYSRDGNSWWRKNRAPQTQDQLGKPTDAVGVDLNRNYGDGNPDHEYLWRPVGDTPGNTWDDFDATSDNPDSDVYRGLSAGSEPEVKTMLDLELNHKNIKGCIDYHSYGNDIFYPWDHTTEEAPHAAIYTELGQKIADATGWSCAQGSALYLNSGDSDETQEVNGMLSFCFEMGRSFQPSPSQIPKVTSQASAGTLVFIDDVIARDQRGELPRA